MVLEPASGTFDVTVPPGENVQAAVDVCPPGGSVLLLPGNHDGPLVLVADKVVHVFGRGRATLRTAAGVVFTSSAVASTVDGLILRREAGGEASYCVLVKSGRLRLQACDITNAMHVSIVIRGGADPTVVACMCVRVQRKWGGPVLAPTREREGLRVSVSARLPLPPSDSFKLLGLRGMPRLGEKAEYPGLP